jgi:hypothetical protein
MLYIITMLQGQRIVADEVSWNTLLNAYARAKDADSAQVCLEAYACVVNNTSCLHVTLWYSIGMPAHTQLLGVYLCAFV